MSRPVLWLTWLCLAMSAVGLRGQSSRFAAYRGARPPAQDASVELGDVVVTLRGSALLVAGEALLGSQGAQPATCTDPGGLGRVYAIERTGFGQCVVGAERGLFVLDERHPWADRVTVRDGMPAGAVVGLASMGDGRLFVCTDLEFACVDLRHGFGFPFGEAEGLPAGPYRGLARAGDQLLLQARDGTFAYQPDAGAPPRPSGGAPERGERTVAFEAPVRLSPPVAADGAVRLRARRQHHHLLTPLVDGALAGLRPGSHVVEVFAVDQDLRRSLVGQYDVRVPPPARFSKRALMAGAGLAGLLLIALSWPRSGRRRAARALLRAGVVGVLSLQLLAALLGYGRSWPFVGFSMYTETYREGSLLYKPLVLGVREDGSEVGLVDWDLGLRQDGYWHVLSELVYGDDALLQKHLSILASRRPSYAVTGLKFTDTRKRLTSDGPVDVAPVILRQWRQR